MLTEPLAWFWLDTTYACGGVAADAAGIVREAAPIYRRVAMGRPLNDVIRAMRRRGTFRAWVRLPSLPPLA
jgi:hypothetical protein